MFLDRVIPKKFQIKQEICSLEALYKEGCVTYHYTVLKNKGKKLEVILKGSMKDKPELPKQILKGKIPINLIINGKGVIIKKVNLPQEIATFENIIEQNLPAMNRDELFIQMFSQNNNTAFIALCRKEQVNQIVNDLIKSKYEIANVLIGAPTILGLKPLWSNFNRIPTSMHSIELNNGNIDSIENSVAEDTKVELDGLEITKEHTLGFAAGLSYLMQSHISESVNEEINVLTRAHNERNKLRFLTINTVAIAFLVAVVNVLFYTSFFDKNNKLETELSVYQGKYDQINQLLTDYQGKKDLIEGAGVLNKNKLSEYADRIGSTIPSEVVLSQIYFNPKKEDEESEDSLVGFETKKLIIKGNCNKSLVVNEWLNVLKMQNFVREVNLEKFTYNKETALPNFEIRIVTN